LSELALKKKKLCLNFRPGPLQPTALLLPSAWPNRIFFFIFLLFFSIYQKYIPIFFCKFLTLPPVHPAEAIYRQMDRR